MYTVGQFEVSVTKSEGVTMREARENLYHDLCEFDRTDLRMAGVLFV